MANPEPIKFYGIKETLRTMQLLEPEMYKALRKNVRQIAAPAVSAVKSKVPPVAPLSGMIGNGRTSWSGVNVTTSITPRQRSRALGSTTANLVSIVATGKNGQYGFNIADMAGRGTGRGRKPKSATREYAYRDGTRTHRIDGGGVKKPNRTYKYNTQGQALITNLGSSPSRYVYPAIESMLPQIISQVAIAIEDASNELNRKLNVN